MDETPDIVLTDIRMPRYGRMELIRRIFRHGPECTVHHPLRLREFEYASEAFMKNGVKYYLVKPRNELQTIDRIEQYSSNSGMIVSIKVIALCQYH